MNGFLLSRDAFVHILLQEPTTLLFGILLMLLSASVVMVFVLKTSPHIKMILGSFLVLIHLILDGILAFDLAGTIGRVYAEPGMASVSALFSTHRWLLIQIPILLTVMALILLWACKDHLKEKHAESYLQALQVCVTVSFLTIILIGYESLI